MSQVNRFYFKVELKRIIMLFRVWCLVLPLYYNTLRGRYLYGKNIWNKVKESEYTLKLIDGFEGLWMVIKSRFEYVILLSLNKQRKIFEKIKRFYKGGQDIDSIGYMIKRSGDIVYAKGVIKVQTSEMVMFEIEGEKLYGIV